MRFYGDFTKVERQENGDLLVAGVASSETQDSAGDIMLAKAMQDAIPDYMKFGAVREMHQPTTAAGTALSLEVDDEKVAKFECLVTDPVAIHKVETGTYKGFSVGGKILQRNAKNKKIIEKIKLTEISLVDRPANPDAVMSLAKFDNDEEASMAKQTIPNEGSTTETPAPETLKKGMWDVQRFAGVLTSLSSIVSCSKDESAWEGDNSPMPAKLKGWLAQGAELFKEMAAEELTEMLAALKIGDEALASGEAAAKADAGAAAGEEPLAKKGAKFSKATKAAFGAFQKAHQDFMKALGIEDDKDEEEDTEKADASEALAKVSGLEENLTKVTAEKDEALGKVESLTAEVEELKKGEAALIEETQLLLSQLTAKGTLRVVGKGDDIGTLAKAEGSATEPATARDAIKAAHRSGGVVR